MRTFSTDSLEKTNVGFALVAEYNAAGTIFKLYVHGRPANELGRHATLPADIAQESLHCI